MIMLRIIFPRIFVVLSLMMSFTSISVAQDVQVISPSQKTIVLDQNSGSLIKLPQVADTVFIANADIAEVMVRSPQLVYLSARKPGNTTLFAVGKNNDILASLNVKVKPDLEGLRHQVNVIFPELDLDISAVGGSVLLRGLVKSPKDAAMIKKMAEIAIGDEKLVLNQLSVRSPSQINLRVQVAEVSRDIQKHLGIDWTADGLIRSATIAGRSLNPLVGNLSPSFLGIGGEIGDVTVNGLISALDEEGLITLLAEPNLTAVSGETASFLAGGEFPILIPDGDNRVVIMFKKFGVSLAFTPVLVNENRISLHVRPEVSELSNENAVTLVNFEVPSLITRRAETTVELGSGQSFAIAGLIQNDSSYDLARTPGLADVPILGQLFKSDTFQRSESELVIVITPYLVEPVDGNPFVKPTDRFYVPKVAETIEEIENAESPNIFRFEEEEKAPRPRIAGFQFD
ncbi:type II and III secretion system protein family protein [Curvivirga sp.]|uniref:type II and III secretion system protein family protein n=1 Tax=Curvivirga sp. TaxID=2856848 RepID=UPI003B59FBC1